jgi:hypothetical protein
MQLRSVTKRLIALEALLAVLLASRMLLGSLGTRLNLERVSKSIEKLEAIPETIAGWEWDRTVKDKSANVLHVTGGGYNLFVRSYVRPGTGATLYVQVCRWLDPLRCYELHGWQIAKGSGHVLRREAGESLRAAGVREAWVERDGERMAVLFWETDLFNPTAVWKGALIEDAEAKGRLQRLWGRTRRRIKSFFRKSAVVAKVIYPEEQESEEARQAVLRFTREVHRMLPDVLR